MKRSTAAMKKSTAVPKNSGGRSGSRRPRGGGGGSGSATTAHSSREQQRKLAESCEPAEEANQRNNKKKTRTKQRQRPPPKFLKGLVRAVTDRSDVVAFKNGRVTIQDHKVLETEVLPTFFKASTTRKSFLRQLNYFTFKKIEGKGVKQPGVFHNATLEGKDVDAILSLKRREAGRPAQESTTADTSQSPRLPRSACSSALARKAAFVSSTAPPVARSPPADSTKVPPPPPPPPARSAYTSSTLLPPPSMAIGSRSGVAVAPTKPEIRGYTSGPRALATVKKECGIATRNGWNFFNARGDHSMSDVNRASPVPFAARDGSSTADRSGSLDGDGGRGGDPSSDGDSKLGAFAAKRKLREHFDGGAVAKQELRSKRGCRYLNRYYPTPNGLRTSRSQGRVVAGGGSGGAVSTAGTGASRQLSGLAEIKPQQYPGVPLADHTAHRGVVPGLSRQDRVSFAFGYVHGRSVSRAGTPSSSSSSRNSIFYAVLPLSGPTWRTQAIAPCPAPTVFAEPPSIDFQSESGLPPETAMAAAAAGRSPKTGRFLRGACAKLGLSTYLDSFPAIEKVDNTTPGVGRGISMDSTVGGVGGGGGGGGLCSGVGGNSMSSFGAEEVFGSFCAVEGDVSPDCLDECFIRERVSSAPGQESLADPVNGGSDFGVGLFHDYSC